MSWTVSGGDVEDNEIDNNIATGNRDGFSAGPMAKDNLFTENYANANDSVGYSDAGTDNTYEDNQCNFNGFSGSDPGGLCSP